MALPRRAFRPAPLHSQIRPQRHSVWSPCCPLNSTAAAPLGRKRHPLRPLVPGHHLPLRNHRCTLLGYSHRPIPARASPSLPRPSAAAIAPVPSPPAASPAPSPFTATEPPFFPLSRAAANPPAAPSAVPAAIQTGGGRCGYTTILISGARLRRARARWWGRKQQSNSNAPCTTVSGGGADVGCARQLGRGYSASWLDRRGSRAGWFWWDGPVAGTCSRRWRLPPGPPSGANPLPGSEQRGPLREGLYATPISREGDVRRRNEADKVRTVPFDDYPHPPSTPPLILPAAPLAVSPVAPHGGAPWHLCPPPAGQAADGVTQVRTPHCF